jgi:hypothetical protein
MHVEMGGKTGGTLVETPGAQSSRGESQHGVSGTNQRFNSTPPPTIEA